MQKLKTSVENPELKGSSLKTGVGQYVAMHAMPTTCFYHHPDSFTCIFSKTSAKAVANTGFYVALQNKIDHPAGCYRQLMRVPMLSAHRI